MMPFIADSKDEILTDKLMQLPEFKDEPKSAIDVAMATFRTENTIGSLVSRESNLPDSIISSDFNAWDKLTDQEKLDKSFSENAVYADSEQELEALRRQTQRERDDRKTMSDAGAMGFVMGLGVGGLADPINLIPIGGTALKTYKTGSSILHSGMVVGLASAASTSAQESLLHATQIERTYGESALNVSASFLLGGVLGMGAKKLSALGVTDKTIKEMNDTFDAEVKLRKGEDSIGAAKVLDDVKVKGKLSAALTKALSFDPLSRTITSKNPTTRKIANFLAENPIEMEGGKSFTAVESLIKLHDGKYVSANQLHEAELAKFKKAGGKTKDFNELVSREVRNGGSDIPEVIKAAKTWEDHLYAPLRKDLIDAGLLPKEVKVKTAKNYLNRVWNKQKLTAKYDLFIKKASRWLADQDKEKLDQAEYDYVADQIGQRILSTPDGRLPYDWEIGNGSKRFNLQGTIIKGPLKNRVFNVPDALVEEFLDNDIQKLGARYLRQVAPDIEIAKAFDGDLDLEVPIKEINDWWTKQIKAEKNPKKAIKMNKIREREIKDVAAMRDRMRGVYGRADFNNPWVRTGRAIRDLNYLRFMGGVVASSIPDVARVFMAEGFAKTFKNGLKPLITNLKRFKVSAAEGKRWGVATDGLLGGRSSLMSDVADYAQGGNKAERLLRSAADKFGHINLMDRWTNGVKQLHLVTMQTSILDGLSKGKFDKRLGRLGIDEVDAKKIIEQAKKWGKKEGGVWESGARNWDDPELQKLWGAALRKESDRVIVMPGQEKPLFMSTEMGKAIFQFRSFMFSSTQRMLIAGIQGQDHNTLGGLLMLTTMGGMAYAFKQWDAGREISSDPSVWVTEGLDRSGSLGIIMEINNTIEKISNQHFGIRPTVGASQPSSRFASRSQLEGLLGPTFGSFAETTLKVLSAGTQDREWTDADTRALRRLLPYQNLMILRQAFDKIEKATGN